MPSIWERIECTPYGVDLFRIKTPTGWLVLSLNNENTQSLVVVEDLYHKWSIGGPKSRPTHNKDNYGLSTA